MCRLAFIGMKSGEMTPINRPQSSMSQSAYGPAPPQSRSRPVATPRKPRPISIAVTGVTSSDQAAASKSPATGERPPLPKVNVTKKSMTPKVEVKKFPNDTSKQSTAKVGTLPPCLFLHRYQSITNRSSGRFFFSIIILLYT